MDLAAALSTLREMFPNHKDTTLQHVLATNQGNLDVAISILLDLPSDKGLPETEDIGPTIEQVGAPTISSGHIFTDDFLRWPSDAHFKRVSLHAAHPTPDSPSLQSPGDVVPQVDLQTAIEINSDLLVDSRPETTANVWDKFKTKFGKKRYQQL